MAMTKIDPIEELGTPAVLEMCAEECVELAHACLKLARKMRDDNPTPKTMEECKNILAEEMGDVYLSMGLVTETELISHESIESWCLEKQTRTYQRLIERKAEKIKNEMAMNALYMKGE